MLVIYFIQRAPGKDICSEILILVVKYTSDHDLMKRHIKLLDIPKRYVKEATKEKFDEYIQYLNENEKRIDFTVDEIVEIDGYPLTVTEYEWVENSVGDIIFSIMRSLREAFCDLKCINDSNAQTLVNAISKFHKRLGPEDERLKKNLVKSIDFKKVIKKSLNELYDDWR